VIARGDIYWIDFGGAVGAEIRKVRPAVVVSTTAHNAHMRTVTVVPLSSASGEVRPNEVAVPQDVLGDGRRARLKTHQIRAVDQGRVGRRFGSLPKPLLTRLERSLHEHLGLDCGPVPSVEASS